MTHIVRSPAIILILSLICVGLSGCSKKDPLEITACVEFGRELDQIKQRSAELARIAEKVPQTEDELIQMSIDGNYVMLEYRPELDTLSEEYEIPCKKALASGWNPNTEAIVDVIYIPIISLVEDRYVFLTTLKVYAQKLDLPETVTQIQENLDAYINDMLTLKDSCRIDVNEKACEPFVEQLHRAVGLE